MALPGSATHGPAVPAQLTVVGASAADPPRRLRVLLVEDDDADAFLVRELLDEVDAAVDVTVATSLAEAMARVGEVDCVLLDLGLPDAQGLDGLRRLIGGGRRRRHLRADRSRRRPPRGGRGQRGRAGLPHQGPGRRHAAGPVAALRRRAQAGRRDRPPPAPGRAAAAGVRPARARPAAPAADPDQRRRGPALLPARPAGRAGRRLLRRRAGPAGPDRDDGRRRVRARRRRGGPRRRAAGRLAGADPGRRRRRRGAAGDRAGAHQRAQPPRGLRHAGDGHDRPGRPPGDRTPGRAPAAAAATGQRRDHGAGRVRSRARGVGGVRAPSRPSSTSTATTGPC